MTVSDIPRKWYAIINYVSAEPKAQVKWFGCKQFAPEIGPTLTQLSDSNTTYMWEYL